ncbi:MAG: hypothetical protein H6619_00200 [Deltaproteobacteria bacterium]|nr:hypothetical protein [Deltaproteobacteria bacterium]
MNTKSDSRYNSILLLICLLALGYRVYACTEVPAVTSDLFRNLGWGSHFFEDSFSIYTKRDFSFKPEVWSFFGNNLIFFYPPVAGFLFWVLSFFGAGLFWAKLLFTSFDLIVAYLFKRHVSLLAATLYFAAPASLWYSSHEGQFESLQVLMITLMILSFINKRWLFSGLFFALGLQVKLSVLFVVPWLLYKIIVEREAIVRFVIGFLAGILPFLGFYLVEPMLLVNPLRQGELAFNPYFYNPFEASRFLWVPSWLVYSLALVTLLMLLVPFASKVKTDNTKSSWISLSPYYSFILYLKSALRAQFWYPLVIPAFLFCIKEKKQLVHLILALYFLLGIRGALFISGFEFGYRENQQKRAVMQQCLYSCNIQGELSSFLKKLDL